MTRSLSGNGLHAWVIAAVVTCMAMFSALLPALLCLSCESSFTETADKQFSSKPNGRADLRPHVVCEVWRDQEPVVGLAHVAD